MNMIRQKNSQIAGPNIFKLFVLSKLYYIFYEQVHFLL